MSDIDRQAADLADAFAKKSIDIDNAIKRAIMKCCIKVTADAVVLAPWKTGMLRKSIAYRVVKTLGGVDGEVGSNLSYAACQEFGTSKMKPRAFLTPALNRNKQYINATLEQELKKEL